VFYLIPVTKQLKANSTITSYTKQNVFYLIPVALDPMLYIPFRHPFRFGHWNEIFRYRSIPVFRFGFTANIYIYRDIYIYIYINFILFDVICITNVILRLKNLYYLILFVYCC
jgi:hypothetical protein